MSDSATPWTAARQASLSITIYDFQGDESMATMKQLWWTHDSEIELKEVEIPEIRPNEVQVNAGT